MIYVITHKVFDDKHIDLKHYKILHVGTNSNCKESYLRDDVGEDNISFKNKNYCELTGQYWIWKNAVERDDDIVGLVHYRRFFTTKMEDILYTYFDKVPQVLEYTTISDTLKNFDILIPKTEKIFRTVAEFYSDIHEIEDLNITRNVIAKLTPEYLDAYNTVINGHSFTFGNMMICNKRIFDDYSEWLFSILFEVEKNIDLEKGGDVYQSRVIGFLSERLLQVWIKKNGLSVKEYPVFNAEEKRITIFRKNYNRFQKLLCKLKKK